MKKYFSIIIFFFPLFLSGQTNSDTITSDQVFIKKIHGELLYFNVNDSINPINKAIVKENKANCNGKIKELKEIRQGKLLGSKRITYYPLSCSVNEVFYTDEKKHKKGTYVKYDELGLKQMEGNFNERGNKEGAFTFYNLKTYYVAYNNGHRVMRYTSKDSLDVNPKVKNIFSVELCSPIMGNYKVVYEHYFTEKHLLKLEFGCKPQAPENATFVFSLSGNNPYIAFAPKRYFIAIENQNLIGYRKYPFYFYRHPFYISYGIYFLNKSYENLTYYHALSEDKRSYQYLQSENSNNYGLRLLIGKKRILGKSNKTLKVVLDYYAGLGICYSDLRKTMYGWGPNKNLMFLYEEPEVHVTQSILPSAFAGLRLGIGW